MEALRGMGALAGGIVLLAGFLGAGLAAATLALPRSRPSARLAIAPVAGVAVAYLCGRVLLAVGAFGAWAGYASAVVAVAIGIVTLRASPARARWIDDLRRAWRAAALLRSPWGLLVAAACALALLRVARGLVIPPMSWDALVYHLFKAGRWVQLGRQHVESAPGAWGFYEYFPGGGDILWAWALLPAHDGMLLPVAGGLVWLGILLCGYAAGRALGAGRRPALAAAAAIASAPAVLGALTASYVDNVGLLIFLASVVLLAEATRPASPPPASMAATLGMVLGLATTVKTTYVTLAAVACATAVIVWLVRGRGRSGTLASIAALLLGVATPFLIECGPTWAAKGSPLYPFALRLAGHTWLPGNAELTAVLAGEFSQEAIARTPLLEPLKWTLGLSVFPNSDYAGFGPGSLIVLLAGTAAAVRALVRSSGRAAIAGITLAAAALIAAASAPDTIALRTIWVGVLGRHLMPAFAAAVLLAATWRSRWTWGGWAFVIAGSLLQAWPRGWGGVDLQAMRELLLPAAAGAALAVGMVLVVRRRAVAALLALVGLGLPLAGVLPALRAATRYPMWAAAAGAEPPYDLHFMDAYAAVSWPMWKRLDDEGPLRIAVLSGWSRDGQSYYLYPLLGSRLQNTVEHVPTTRDGDPADWYRPDDAKARLDLRAFVARLLEREIDRIVVLYPSPPERVAWLQGMHEMFPYEMGDEATDNWLYGFDRNAARRWLRDNP